MISKYSVKRPFTVLVGVVLFIVLGVVALMRMTTDLLPDMSFQYALVITMDIGASPEKVESDVTAPIEAAMATTANIKNISSASRNSYSIVTLEYEQNANMDSVVIEIQQKLDQLSGNWPDTVGTPMIMKINPDMLPILIAAVDMDDMDASQLSNYVQNDLIPSIESVEGVASVSASGQLEEHVTVTLNQEKIDALNERIKAAIDKQFEKPQEELDKGLQQIENGQAAIANGSQQMGDAVEQITEQRELLFKTEEDLKTQLADLKEKREQLQQVQDGISAFLESEEGRQLQMLPALVSGLEQTIGAIEQSGMDETVIQTMTDPLKKQMDSLNATLKNANAAIAAQFGALEAMGVSIKNVEDLIQAQGTISGLMAQLNTGIATIESALVQVEEGKMALRDAVATLNTNAALAAIQMGATSAQLATAAASLESAQATLDDAKDKAHESADLNQVLSLSTIVGLLTAQNFDMPAGYAYEGEEQFLVRVGESVKSLEELTDLVLINLGMDEVGAIYLSDVADVEMVDNSAETYAIINGNPGIMLSMEKQTGYSTGEVTDRVLKKFESLEKANSKLHLSVLMNQGVYIDLIVDSVVENMVVGAILAIVVLVLFLKDVKPTIVIACSIPLSVVMAVVFMYFTGISLNIISMSGLVLGIGMLVDNSIVVIENIYRLRNEGYSIRKAAVEGASQVAGAIVASTLTTISVYAPIIFTEGITRQLFVDLALTVAYTLVASLAIALTFVPAASSAILRKTREIKHPWFDRIKSVYGQFLAMCLRFKAVVFIVSVVLLVVSALAAYSRGLTFMDMDMESNQLSATITAKDEEPLSFAELTEQADLVLERIADVKGIDTVGAMSGGGSTLSSLSGGGNEGISLYILLDEDSGVRLKEVEKQIQDRTADLNCEVVTSTSSMDFSAFFGKGLSVRIKGSDLNTLQELAAKVAEVVRATEGTVDVEDGLDKATPQLVISVDKEKAAKYNYTVAQVFQLVYAKMASSTSATTLTTDIKDYEVFLQTEEQAKAQLADIKNLTFTYKDKEGNEEEIPLTRICTMTENTTLSTINRDAQTRYLTVSCGIDEDHNVTLVSNKVQAELDKLAVPEGYSISMEGEDETINESMNQMVLMLLLAVIFIYLIMVAQFQSLLAPFIIMFSIPLAFTGGFIALFFAGIEISIISMLGFIMLAGLIVNNGIVLIDYINQERRLGKNKKEAIVEAGETRLRPILMTALTTILAMSTSAVGMGQGSEMMKPMAVTIIGGLVYGTLLTLIVIPCIYDAFHREKSMVEEEL